MLITEKKRTEMGRAHFKERRDTRLKANNETRSARKKEEEQTKRKVWIAWVREGARQNGTEEIIRQGKMERAHP